MWSVGRYLPGMGLLRANADTAALMGGATASMKQKMLMEQLVAEQQETNRLLRAIGTQLVAMTPPKD